MPGDEDRTEWAREVYGGLLDAGLTTYDTVIDVDPDDDRAPDVARLLDGLFVTHPEYRGVALRLRGAPEESGRIGISGHARVRESLGVAGDPGGPAAGADWGAGDRAGLLGMSTQYRTLLFVCPLCAREETRVFYDERALPRCATGHGVMELVR
ncbi:hypothetical protein [Streptomyces sp. NPDC005209]|uniref:hypothetical protein n=1 Tax=Streptomyces sp. NPDC005209 TaxID=3156715 RepID=UPI0033AFECE0